MSIKYVRYAHHGAPVWVKAEDKGQHRDHCLCWGCQAFCPTNREVNCPIANALYQFDVEHNVTTPVWECAKFRPTNE